MATLLFGKVSSLDYKTGKADITLTDKDGMVLTSVPFLAKDYDMPQISDTVAVIVEIEKGRCDRAVILGPVWSNKNVPDGNKNIYYKKFSDGTKIKYDSSKKEMEVSTEKLIVNELVYEKLTQR